MVQYGRQIADWAVHTRAIPGGKAKKFEMASREVNKTRPPPSMNKWWEKGKEHLELLVESATWPERKEGDESGIRELVALPPFTVHNTVHLPDEKLEKTLEAVRHVAKQIQRKSPKLAKVLYGDVYLVGKISRPSWAAWYIIAEDTVHLRPLLKKGGDDARDLTHELGHRYWFKFMDTGAINAWEALYDSMKNKGENMATTGIEVGKPLPIPVKGFDTPPTVLKIEFGRIYIDDGTGVQDGKPYKLNTYLPYTSVYSALVNENVRKMFPSNYAATQPEEFFAECFAYYILDQLSPELVADFERIVKP